MKLKYIIISSGIFFTMILTGIGLNYLEKPNQENYVQEASNENIIFDGRTKNVELVENSEIVNDTIVDENNILQEQIDKNKEEIKIEPISESKKDEKVKSKQTIKEAQDENPENLLSEKEEPSILARYLINLAEQYSSFYNNCHILGEEKETQDARLYLTYMVKTVLEKGLNLLGIQVPNKM